MDKSAFKTLYSDAMGFICGVQDSWGTSFPRNSGVDSSVGSFVSTMASNWGPTGSMPDTCRSGLKNATRFGVGAGSATVQVSPVWISRKHLRSCADSANHVSPCCITWTRARKSTMAIWRYLSRRGCSSGSSTCLPAAMCEVQQRQHSPRADGDGREGGLLPV